MELFIISFTVSFLSILCIYIYLRISTKRKILKDEDPEWHKAHYKMWDWLSKHPDANKFIWIAEHPEYIGLSGDLCCFACEQASRSRRSELGKGMFKIRCNYCPFDIKARSIVKRATLFGFGNNDVEEICLEGLWLKWKCSLGKERVKIAKQIRDFPLHKD